MDVKDLIARGSREVDWDSETHSTIAVMIRDVQDESARPRRWSIGRKLLIGLPVAVVLIGGLTAGGVSVLNGLAYAPDAVVPFSYTAADGTHLSCEIAVTATYGPAKQFIKDHNWSDVSQKLQQASQGQPNVTATPGAAGSAPRSVVEIIDSEIPAGLWGKALLNLVETCQ